MTTHTAGLGTEMAAAAPVGNGSGLSVLASSYDPSGGTASIAYSFAWLAMCVALAATFVAALMATRSLLVNVRGDSAAAADGPIEVE
ncbi:MAG: hypothetical protein FDZ70_06700 [Actinobacteria bacterium]|nr:MAG: hypothetical protein FDZ70_06700 [Actinomycetota bacterium]